MFGRAWRSVLWTIYAGYGLGVCYLVWTPSPTAPGRGVDLAVRAAARVGLALSSADAEFLLNIAMLVPLSFIGGLLLRRLSAGDWTLVGFALACTIEGLQLLALPTRDPSARDIVANTAGAAVGAIALAVVLAGVNGSPRLRRHVKIPSNEGVGVHTP